MNAMDFFQVTGTLTTAAFHSVIKPQELPQSNFQVPLRITVSIHKDTCSSMIYNLVEGAVPRPRLGTQLSWIPHQLLRLVGKAEPSSRAGNTKHQLLPRGWRLLSPGCLVTSYKDLAMMN